MIFLGYCTLNKTHKDFKKSYKKRKKKNTFKNYMQFKRIATRKILKKNNNE